jgi:hypothetical protein
VDCQFWGSSALRNGIAVDKSGAHDPGLVLILAVLFAVKFAVAG